MSKRTKAQIELELKIAKQKLDILQLEKELLDSEAPIPKPRKTKTPIPKPRTSIPKPINDLDKEEDTHINKLFDESFTYKPIVYKIDEYGKVIEEYAIENYSNADIDTYCERVRETIKSIIEEFKRSSESIKFELKFTGEFLTPLAFDQVEAYFSNGYHQLNTMNSFENTFQQIANTLNSSIDQYQQMGSGYIFNNLKQVNIRMVKTFNISGSSYFKPDFKNNSTYGILNIQNKDNKCFLWCILAKLYPIEKNSERVSKYQQYENKINMSNIEYPVKIKDIHKIENINTNLAINVFALENSKDIHSIYPIYESGFNSNREYIIDLLYLNNGNTNHYCLLKKGINSLMRKNDNKVHICRRCLQSFRTETSLTNHKYNCNDNPEVKVVMPKKEILKFNNYHFKHRLPVVMYCDFESINKKINNCSPTDKSSYKTKLSLQEIISFGLYIKSDREELIESQYISFTGEKCAEEFVNRILDIYENINKTLNINGKKNDRPLLNKFEEEKFQNSKNCYMCNIDFNDKSGKVREHCHITGEYRGAACISCNVMEGKKCKIVPVFFHNGSNYDFHFIISELFKHKSKYNKVKLLSKTTEEYISIDFGNNNRVLRFLDSYRFMPNSLDNISKSLKQEDMHTLQKFFENDVDFSLVKQKGIYPYEYIDSLEKMQDVKLPSIDKFYSTLRQTGITEKDYDHAINVWNHFKCSTFLEYHELYLKIDILLLVDAFEKYREFFLGNYDIDPCYCYSAPGLSWQCGLKKTKIELELLEDYDMLMMFEKGIRGGYSGVLGSRHVKANNKYLKDFDETKESNYLLYLDANNLYGWAMSQNLPTEDFKWEEDEDYYKNVPFPRGCIIECDLEYCDETKLKTHKFPLAPEKLTIDESELSPYQRNVMATEKKQNIKSEKLILNLKDKEKYVIHYKMLEYYENLGLKVKKVYRTISFKERAWLKEYIDFNTNQRKIAKSDFEKDLFKLLNNSFYGKTVENIRNRTEVQLCSSDEEIKKYASKANFKGYVKFDENTIAMQKKITSIYFNKPIYIGMCVLDYSKLLMYKFYYERINKIWKRNEIVGYDTDSFFLNIHTEDVYEDMKQMKNDLDTSDYPKEHNLHSEENKKIIGKFKDELNGKIMSEIVFLRSKAYSYRVEDEEKKKLKGITKSTIQRISFDEYKNSLVYDYTVPNYCKMYQMNSDKHRIHIYEVNKKSISPFDDKRYILNDAIKTIPHCDETTRNRIVDLLNH